MHCHRWQCIVLQRYTKTMIFYFPLQLNNVSFFGFVFPLVHSSVFTLSSFSSPIHFLSPFLFSLSSFSRPISYVEAHPLPFIFFSSLPPLSLTHLPRLHPLSFIIFPLFLYSRQPISPTTRHRPYPLDLPSHQPIEALCLVKADSEMAL